MSIVFLVLVFYSIYLVRFSYYRFINVDYNFLTSILAQTNMVAYQTDPRYYDNTNIESKLKEFFDNSPEYKNGTLTYKVYSNNSYQLCLTLNMSYDERKKFDLTLDGVANLYSYYSYKVAFENTSKKDNKYVDCYKITVLHPNE